jgi:hypothetical protein
MITKIKHYVCPVCSGKSTTAQKLQNLDPENTLLIEVQSSTNLDLIYKKFIKGCKFKKIIIDNFLNLYSNKKNEVNKFVQYIKSNSVEEIILFSTPDRLYNKNEDKKELKEKFLDGSEVEVIQEFYTVLPPEDRIILYSTLNPNEFQTKVLGALYDSQYSHVMI